MPAIQEAARIFRPREALDAYLIEGPFVRLERAEGAADGKVTIIAAVEDVQRNVVVTLPAAEYDIATLAHREFRHVRVVGTVTRQGRAYHLGNPTGFALAGAVDGGD